MKFNREDKEKKEKRTPAVRKDRRDLDEPTCDQLREMKVDSPH